MQSTHKIHPMPPGLPAAEPDHSLRGIFQHLGKEDPTRNGAGVPIPDTVRDQHWPWKACSSHDADGGPARRVRGDIGRRRGCPRAVVGAWPSLRGVSGAVRVGGRWLGGGSLCSARRRVWANPGTQQCARPHTGGGGGTAGDTCPTAVGATSPTRKRRDPCPPPPPGGP